MKKFLALVLIGVMAIGTAVFAAESPDAYSALVSTEQAQELMTTYGMSAGEVVNNSVSTAAPGLDESNVIPMGAPAGCLIDGVPSGYTMQVRKATALEVLQGKQALPGKFIVNVLKPVNFPAGASAVQVPFYAKGVKAGDKISAYQINGGNVLQCKTNVRADHVDTVITSANAVYMTK